MWEIIQMNLFQIILVLFTGIATYIATKIKTKQDEYINNDTKQRIVKTVVSAVEQLYKDLDGEQKLSKAKEYIIELLKEKGLSITELEMNIMIEEVVNSFHQVLQVKEQNQ